MEPIVFDTGPLISLTLNNLLWVLDILKKNYKGNFIMPIKVKEELIDQPLTTKKYKLEALQVLPYINRETLIIFNHPKLDELTNELLSIANNIYEAKGQYITIVHFADMQVIASAILTKSTTIVVDEFTTRALVEDPKKVAERMERKLHTKIRVNETNLKKIKEYTKGIQVLRSVEIISIAYEKGILDRYLFEGEKKFIEQPKKAILEGALWGLKLNGCSISEEEIFDVLKIEGHIK